MREKNFDGRERSAVAKEFSKKAELEMEMSRQREAAAKRLVDDKLKATPSSATPRIAGFGQTPRRSGGLLGAAARLAGGSTPRRGLGSASGGATPRRPGTGI